MGKHRLGASIDPEEMKEALEGIGPLPEEIAEALEPLMNAQIQTAEHQKQTAAAVERLVEENERQRRRDNALLLMTGVLLLFTGFLVFSQVGLL